MHVTRRQLTPFGFSTRKDAEVALAEVLEANARGSAVAVNNTTTASYTAHVNGYFVPRIGHQRLRDLRPHHVEAELREIVQQDRWTGSAP